MFVLLNTQIKIVPQTSLVHTEIGLHVIYLYYHAMFFFVFRTRSCVYKPANNFNIVQGPSLHRIWCLLGWGHTDRKARGSECFRSGTQDHLPAIKSFAQISISFVSSFSNPAVVRSSGLLFRSCAKVSIIIYQTMVVSLYYNWRNNSNYNM